MLFSGDDRRRLHQPEITERVSYLFAMGSDAGYEVHSPTSVLYELAAADLRGRREVATTLRRVSETFSEVRDGKTASHVLGVLAHLLDPS